MSAASEWARCRHWITAALRRSPGLETIADVERLIAEGKYQFWAGARSAAITEIQECSGGSVLTVVHGGGELTELLDSMEPAMCAYARAHDCRAILGTGRKGWERAAKTRGYRLAWIVMIKDLGG